MPNHVDRRTFLFSGAALASRASVSANDRVAVGVIGVRGRGGALTAELSALPDVDIPYVCDVDARVFVRAVKAVTAGKGKAPATVADLRRILDDRSIDAVVIATPDHWHAPAALMACQAGKDVYVEKPVSHNIAEGRVLVETARRHKRVVQAGMQARSRPQVLRAMEYIKSGKIGKVLAAKAWNIQQRVDIGHRPDTPVPPQVDYDTWVGPAPFLPFNENRFHDKWHWHWNFGTGDMGNDGIHQLDMARWALDAGMPDEVAGTAGKLFFKDDQQTPDTMNITFRYPGKMLIFEMRIWNPYGMDEQENGVAVYGSEGMVHVGRWGRNWGFKVYDAKGMLALNDQNPALDTHPANFIQAVRSRKTPNADIAEGHISSLHCHLGNIVARTGRQLKFDGATQSIVGDAEANRLCRREYRKHWAVPAVA
jgi:predicted dehydrogenase